ncbi:hypothetical protein ABVT39_011153 [Epinephelus coioides]
MDEIEAFDRAAAGVRGAAQGRPGEQQACLIRQGLMLSAQQVLSLLRNTDIVQTPTNSTREGTAKLRLLSASDLEEKGVCAWMKEHHDEAMEGCCCGGRMRSEGNGSIH